MTLNEVMGDMVVMWEINGMLLVQLMVASPRMLVLLQAGKCMQKNCYACTLAVFYDIDCAMLTGLIKFVILFLR